MPAQAADRILAIDVGTTSVKAALLDGVASVLATGVAAQRIGTDPTGRRDHDPEVTWGAVQHAIAGLWPTPAAARGIQGVVVTGPRGSFGIGGPDGSPRGPMLTWQDRRAAGVVPALIERGGPGHRAIIGYELTASAVLPKLLWLRDTQPHSLDAGWRVITPQGDVLRRLGAAHPVIDLSTAGYMGLLDVHSQAWSDSLLAHWSLDASVLPELVPQGAVVGSLGTQVARRLSLPPGIPLIAAGSDGVCSELGAGVVETGQIYAYLGTAGAVAGPLDQVVEQIHEALVVMPGSTPERRRLLGLIGAGGSARDWAMALLGVRDHRRFDRMVQRSPAGARGLLFLPTLAGASAPTPDDRARGMLVGASLANDRDDVARAVLEGVALEMRAIVVAMAASIPTPTEVRLTGGGSRSDAWACILADVLRVPVLRIAEPNPGLRGAAQYALASIGRYPSAVAAAAALPPSYDRFLPDPGTASRYQDAADVYALVRRCGRDGGIDERLFQHGTAARDDRGR